MSVGSTVPLKLFLSCSSQCTVTGPPEPNRILRRVKSQFPWPVTLLVLLLAGMVAFALLARSGAAPAETSREVVFVRGMIQHHAQAVDMATRIRDRSSDRTLRSLEKISFTRISRKNSSVVCSGAFRPVVPSM